MALNLFNKKPQQDDELQKALKQLAVFANTADRERNTYNLLLASIGEAVFVVDTNKRVTIMNKAAEQMIGKPTSEAYGKAVYELFDIVDKEQKTFGEAEWTKAIEEKVVIRLSQDAVILTKMGVKIPVVVTIAPIVDRNTESLQGFVVTLLDVTAERALEEARIRFISTASHQLRTPMTSVRWYAELLMEGALGQLSEDQKHAIADIYTSINRLIDLLNLLLQVSRIEANRVKTEPVPTDIVKLTDEVYHSLESQFRDKSQQLQVFAEGTIPTLPMDKMIVWQVIQNYITNASNYSPKNSTIEVHIKMTAEGLQYGVTDHGIGVPQAARARLFEKFYRADNALKVRANGSGIGLSLCKSLAEGWGGRVWFESEEGKGSTFYFTMPKEGMKAKAGEVGIAI